MVVYKGGRQQLFSLSFSKIKLFMYFITLCSKFIDAVEGMKFVAAPWDVVSALRLSRAVEDVLGSTHGAVKSLTLALYAVPKERYQFKGTGSSGCWCAQLPFIGQKEAFESQSGHYNHIQQHWIYYMNSRSWVY